MSTSRSAIALAILTVPMLLDSSLRASAGEELAAVKGTVILDGKPLSSGKVFFHLSDGQFIGSKIKEDGTYKVDRVPVGTHKVTVEVLIKGRSILPPKYALEEKSALRVEVANGLNTLDFSLKSK